MAATASVRYRRRGRVRRGATASRCIAGFGAFTAPVRVYAAWSVPAWIEPGPGVLSVVTVGMACIFLHAAGMDLRRQPGRRPFTGTFILCAIMTLAWSRKPNAPIACCSRRATPEKPVSKRRTAELFRCQCRFKLNEIRKRRCLRRRNCGAAKPCCAQGRARAGRQAGCAAATGMLCRPSCSIYSTDRAGVIPFSCSSD